MASLNVRRKTSLEAGPLGTLPEFGDATCAQGAVAATSNRIKLHNFAMPLIRYELRDYAKVGSACSCGRGLPLLESILGRNRNMVMLPNGEKHWPLVGFAEYRAIAPVRQYQLIQHTLEEIEVRLVTDRPLVMEEETRLTEVIQHALGWPFRLQFAYFEHEIPRGVGGKFEEFVSKVET